MKRKHNPDFGTKILDGEARAGWTPAEKHRRKFKAPATAENPAAKIARKAEKRGLLRLKFD